jgi:hypothetical protein
MAYSSINVKFWGIMLTTDNGELMDLASERVRRARVIGVLIVLCYDETSLCIVEGGDVCSGVQEK